MYTKMPSFLSRLMLLTLFGLLFTSPVFSAKPLKNDSDKISYALGARIAKQYKNQSFELKSDLFIAGFQDGFQDKKTRLSDTEINKTLIDFQKNQREAKQKAYTKMATKNLMASKAFLAKNKAQKGIVTLKTGLQYKIITPGKGTSPAPQDTVTVHYKGTLIDGTLFDSSYVRKKPATFPVSAVIAGWKQALQLMKPGAKWQLFIPAELAYGTRGAGSKIGPNMALLFEVALLAVDKKAPPKTSS